MRALITLLVILLHANIIVLHSRDYILMKYLRILKRIGITTKQVNMKLLIIIKIITYLLKYTYFKKPLKQTVRPNPLG